MKAMLKKILGSQHAREVKKLEPVVEQINQFCEGLSSLSDDELRGKTDGFRTRIQEWIRPLEEKIDGLREEKRNSEDASVREALTQEIAGLDQELLAAIEEAVPANVLSAALYARFRSQQEASFANKTLSAMRMMFGGHQEPK